MTNEQKILTKALTVKMIQFIMTELNLGAVDAMRIVYGSDTYASLTDVSTGRYTDGSVCLCSDLLSEILTGRMPAEY